MLRGRKIFFSFWSDPYWPLLKGWIITVLQKTARQILKEWSGSIFAYQINKALLPVEKGNGCFDQLKLCVIHLRMSLSSNGCAYCIWVSSAYWFQQTDNLVSGRKRFILDGKIIAWEFQPLVSFPIIASSFPFPLCPLPQLVHKMLELDLYLS